MSKKNQNSGVCFTLTRWAKELTIDPKTLAAKLKKAGHTIERFDKYRPRDVILAVYGDAEQERIRGLRLANEDAERDAEVKAGKLHHLESVEEVVWEKGLSPLRDALLNLSKVAGPQSNPENPVLAQKVIDEHVARILKQLEDSVPKPKLEPIK